MCVKENRIDL